MTSAARGGPVDDRELSGEERLKRRNRQLIWLYGVLMVMGGACGYLLSSVEPDGSGILEGTIPVWAAIVLSLGWLAAMTIGSVFGRRVTDEMAWSVNRAALGDASGVTFLGYPIWYFLSRADLVVVPSAGWLFLATYAVFMLSIGVRVCRQYR